MRISSQIDVPEIFKHLFSEEKLSFELRNEVVPEKIELGPDSALTCHSYSVNGESPTFIIFPSTRVSQELFVPIVDGLMKNGCNVIVVSYTKEVSLSQLVVESDAALQKVYGWLSEQRQQPQNGPIILMGQALGTLIAIDLATRHADKIKGLFLESSIGNLLTYLEAIGAPVDDLGITEDEDCDVLELISTVKSPTLFYHGSQDNLTPVVLAEKLQVESGAKTKQFFVIPGGIHEALHVAGGDLYFQTIKKFVDTICDVNTWQQRRRRFKDKVK